MRRDRARQLVTKRQPLPMNETVPPPGEFQMVFPPEHIGHCSEADLIKELVVRFRWRWEGKDKLGRHNPFGINVRAIVEGEADEVA